MKFFKLTIYFLIALGLLAGGFFVFKKITQSPVSPQKIAREFGQAPDIKKEYRLNKAALEIEPKDQNSVGVVLGEANAKEFVPNLEINKWDGETKFKLKPDISNVPADQKKVTLDGEIGRAHV